MIEKIPRLYRGNEVAQISFWKKIMRWLLWERIFRLLLVVWMVSQWELVNGHTCFFNDHQSLQSEPNLSINYIKNTSSSSWNHCYSIQSENSQSKDYCFPSLIVAGFPKCGSSFIFKMLSSHPLIIPTKRKELCLGGILSETWSKFFTFLPNVSSSENKLVMSGCLHLGANIRAMKELCQKDLKLIYVLRDVAEMLWSAYNFWCIKNYDRDCSPGKHTSKTATRSPQHFHQLILNSKEMGGGISLTKSGNCYRKELQEATKIFGVENILVLKSEMMLTEIEKSQTVNQIQEFLFVGEKNQQGTQSLVRDWLVTQSQTIYRVNSGRSIASRGEKNIVNGTHLIPGGGGQGRGQGRGEEGQGREGREEEGLYEVSHFQPMLPETRQLIYQRWQMECNWLKDTYQIHYRAAC